MASVDDIVTPELNVAVMLRRSDQRKLAVPKAYVLSIDGVTAPAWTAVVEINAPVVSEFPALLILPNPAAIEPEASAPTVTRFAAVVTFGWLAVLNVMA